MQRYYLGLAVVGAVIPYSQFVPWFADHGPNSALFFGELFSTRIGGFFGLDVFISAIALLGFIRQEAVRTQMRWLWLPIGATCLIGVSCGLPLFLYLRERQHAA